MKTNLAAILCLAFLTSFFCLQAHAAKKAKILGDVVEVYSDANFDSEQISEVYKDEVYQVSDKAYGPFYRIRLKSGKVGYIVDYQLNIEGVGPIKPRDLDELELLELRRQRAADPNKFKKQESEDGENFDESQAGPTLQFINYHEDTMGSEQVADLPALGYRSVGLTTWSVVGTWVVPNYYTNRTGYKAQGIKLWADFGVSNTIVQLDRADIRIAGSLFTHASLIKVETPARNYDLHDITLGANLELSLAVKLQSWTPDLFIKYYFDKSRYASLGLSVLF